MDMRIPALRVKILLESNPLKSTMLVGRLAVPVPAISVSFPEKKTKPSRRQVVEVPLEGNRSNN